MLHTGQSSVLTGPCQSSHSPQAHGDLVSAVDFSEDHLVTGYEDSNVGVWSMETGRQLHDMPGHNGGVTGIQIQLNLAASSSYDSTVIIYNLDLRDIRVYINCFQFMIVS